MTTTQPNALRLAEDLQLNGEYCPENVYLEAAAELRRLHQSEREGWRYADEVEQERKTLQAMLSQEREESEARIAALEGAIKAMAHGITGEQK